MAHIHSVYDTDKHFSINPTTRTIVNECGKVVLIQGDHNSERFTFELPRLIDGHDMSTCNVVQVHFNNIDAKSGAESRDVYEVSDLQLSPEDDNVVICSWLLSRNATKYVGALGFVIRFACVTYGTVEYDWHTAVHKDLTVLAGINNSDAVVNSHSDVLEAWRSELFTGGGSSGSAKMFFVTVTTSASGDVHTSDCSRGEIIDNALAGRIGMMYCVDIGAVLTYGGIEDGYPVFTMLRTVPTGTTGSNNLLEYRAVVKDDYIVELTSVVISAGSSDGGTDTPPEDDDPDTPVEVRLVVAADGSATLTGTTLSVDASGAAELADVSLIIGEDGSATFGSVGAVG